MSRIREKSAIYVYRSPQIPHQGRLIVGTRTFLCAIGRGGLTSRKTEGDGSTPIGRWSLREVFYRADRRAKPRTGLPVRPILPNDGWCDAPQDRNYNRIVTLPYAASAERLWRDDHLYDLIGVLGYNDRPRIRGRGSAIFIHLARSGFPSTEGCLALEEHHLRLLLRTSNSRTVVTIPG